MARNTGRVVKEEFAKRAADHVKKRENTSCANFHKVEKFLPPEGRESRLPAYTRDNPHF
jgi:hypothetical protein